MRFTQLILFLLLLNTAIAQEEEYTIFYNNAKDYRPSSLSNLDGILKIRKSDTAVILHSSGKWLMLHEKGKYNKKTLDKLFSQADSIMLAKQAKYLVNSQLFRDGVEYRRVGGLGAPPSRPSFIFFPERHTRRLVYGDSIVFSWDFRSELPKPDSCKIIIQDLVGNTFTELYTTNNLIEFSIKNILKNQELLGNFICIEAQNLESEDQQKCSVCIQTNLSSPRINPPIEDWLTNCGENHLANALFFEEQSIPIDAYFAYKKALAQSAENLKIQFLFRMFKLRNGISKLITN